MDEISDHAQASAIAIIALPAFNDNYIWLLRRNGQAIVVDPGEAAPVLDYLDRHDLSLCAILVTHHHGDHIGGIDDLLIHAHASIPVFGPAGEPIEALTHRLKDGDHIDLPQFGVGFDILGIPGHTRDHIAYYTHYTHYVRGATEHSDTGKLAGSGETDPFAGSLFCGDTLFSCGCGRVFEGTPPQMRASLASLAALPGDTRIYPAHEYTQANTRFALAVEPQNDALKKWAEKVAQLRAEHQPTLPTTLSHELAVNPFLRWDAPAVIAAASRFAEQPLNTADEVFTAIRRWKNGF